jgi:DNA-directed RNA polymerase specialized sigma24 family protein
METTLEILYERYVDPIYASALHCLRARLAAEDVVAETFQRALEHRDRDAWPGVPFSASLHRACSAMQRCRAAEGDGDA